MSTRGFTLIELVLAVTLVSLLANDGSFMGKAEHY